MICRGVTPAWPRCRKSSLPLEGLTLLTPFPPPLPPTPQLAKALLREGRQERRRASRLSSRTQATLRQASRQVLASGARGLELEEAKQVRVLGPHPISSRPREPAGSCSRFSSIRTSPKVGTGLSEMEQQIRESRSSLVEDVKALSELLTRLGKKAPRLGPGSLGHLRSSP